MVSVVKLRFMFSVMMIHPMCAIDEKAMIFRVCVWLIPVKPPTRADNNPIISTVLLCMESLIMYSKAIGASFCHVEIIMAVFMVEPCSTSGYHACIGARPSLSKSAITIIAVVWGEVCMIDHCPVCQALRVLANRINAAAVV